MTRFFVSYSRSVKAGVAQVVDKLRSSGHEVWWDGDIPIMADWWATILKHIEWCEVFIFVASEKSVESPYCLAELKYANARQRPILPFIIGDPNEYHLPDEMPPRGQWLLYNGDPLQMLTQINEAYATIDWNQYRDIDARRPPEPMTGGKSLAQQFQEARRLANTQQFEDSKRLFQNIKRLDYGEWGTDCDTWLARLTSYEAVVELAGDEATLDRARREWHSHIEHYGDEFDPHNIRTMLRLTSFQPVKNSRLWMSVAFTVLVIAVGVIVLVGLNSNRDQPHNGTSVSAFEQLQHIHQMQTETAAFATLKALSVTPTFTVSPTLPPTFTLTVTNTVTPTSTRRATRTPIPTPNRTATLEALLFQGIQENADWRPITRRFDGVEMVLIPVGCFVMGSSTEQIQYAINEFGASWSWLEGESPAAQICINRPFWMDAYEVTNEQYGSVGCSDVSSRPDEPRNCLTWFEAVDFCLARGMRLPTEAEWEFAARGPDSLIFYWGNNVMAFVANYSAVHTNSVGEYPNTSWVGAYDMAGNVWEWTSSLYSPYPYNMVDGREANTGSRDDVNRIVRGGSYADAIYYLRAANRGYVSPYRIDNRFGLRCVRDY